MKPAAACLLAALLALQPALSRAAEGAPELPKGSDATEAPEAKGDAEVDVPKGVPIVHKKPARFRVGNLILGALGGAVLSGGVAFLAFSRNEASGGIDYDKAKVVVPLAAGGGALAGGLLSFLLGATSPVDPTPPDMEAGLHPAVAYGPQISLSLRF